MKDIELPPLPDADVYTSTALIGYRYSYSNILMQSYARAAVEADRAQRVPDGWRLVPVEPTEGMLEAGRAYFQATYLDSFTTKEHYRRMLQMTPSLASTPAPAKGAQRVPEGWRDVLSNLLWAATERDAKNRIRQFDEFVDAARNLLASTPAPAQQEPTEDAGITRGEWIGQAVRVYLAAGDTEADASECAAYLWREQDVADLEDPLEAALSDIEGRPTAQPQEQPQQERKPMTDEEIDRVLSTVIPGGSTARDWFLPHDTESGLKNVRDVVRRMFERHPGIKE